MRKLRYYQAINEAQRQSMEADPSVLLLGIGVTGPTGIFGTTSGLVDRFGKDRVLDIPSSEQGMTGVALGMTVAGFRPVMIHIRVDFATLAMDQMVNQVAKWHFMYGGKLRAPMVFRMIIGRGWGQGPQHSQSLQAWFAHIPGFKVVMPTTPNDVKGMLLAAIADDAPVVVFEHRWLYNIEGDVPEAPYKVSLDKANIVRRGRDVTLVGTSYMMLEALRAAELLATLGIEAEVIDVRSIVPLDTATITASVKRTGALVVADTGTIDFGVGAEIVSRVVEADVSALRHSPRRVGLPYCPSPTSPALAEEFFPRAIHIVRQVGEMLGIDLARLPTEPSTGGGRWHDTPDASFTGPY
jgi:pyruvate dehydrogenase E1 component beta subunit